MSFLTNFADLFFLTLWMPLLWAAVIGFASNRRGWQGRGLTIFLALVPVAAAAIYFGISHASDESFLLAGVIPWSDAAAHFAQAAEMATHGVTHFGMNGRFLYPAFFSSLLNITGLNLLRAEIISWIFFAAALALLLRLVARLTGVAGASVVALVCGLFFRARCAGLIMTENFGILCGLLAVSALLMALQKRNFWMLQLGIFILALGLVARPGPMFVLPLMIFYVCWVAWKGWWRGKAKSWKRTFFAGGIALALVLGAFVSNTLLSRSVYEGKVIVNGNFSFTLYGILTGGKWSDALGWSHYNAPLVMQENIRLIKEEPQRLIFGAFRAYKEALYRRILFMFGHESRPATLLLLLAIFGLVALWKVHQFWPYAWCLTLIAVGILFSIPFAPPWDAAERPFAVTVPFQALFAAIGLAVLLQSVFFKKEKKKYDEKNLREGKWLALFIGIIFFLAVPFPVLHRFYFSVPLEVSQEGPVMLFPGSCITVTPENRDDFLQRLVPFLNHYPMEQEFFSKLPQQVMLGIDWKAKNFDHCATLDGVREVANFHYWLVDQRLLQEMQTSSF